MDAVGGFSVLRFSVLRFLCVAVSVCYVLVCCGFRVLRFSVLRCSDVMQHKG